MILIMLFFVAFRFGVCFFYRFCSSFFVFLSVLCVLSADLLGTESSDMSA